MWEPAGAVALSIFITVSLLLTVVSLAYLVVASLIKITSYVKKQIIHNGDHNDI